MAPYLVTALALSIVGARAWGFFASEPAQAADGVVGGKAVSAEAGVRAEAATGAEAEAGTGAAHIMMQVRLSARSPVRFTLDQDATAMAVWDEVIARETTLGRSFTAVLGASGAGDGAYQVEVARFEHIEDALGLRSKLATCLSYDDRVRCLPYIVPEGDRWVLRIGKTGDPDTVYRLRAALAWAGMERGFLPTPVVVRPQAEERTRLVAAGGACEVRAGDLPGEVVLATASGESMSFPGGRVRIVPRNPLDIGFTLGGVRYKGELEVARRDSWDGKVELVATNRVDIESYVEGVLAGEVYPNWEMEALKAQAVAARTYALYRKADSYYDRGYDVDDTVAYQKYSGGHAIQSFRQAVAETRGEVITYQGRLIKAHYFASGGGTTEGDEEIWPGGGDEPYLEAVADFDQISPHYLWQNPLAMWAGDLLAKLGLGAAFPAWIEPSLTSDSGEKVLAYRFRTAAGSATLTREQVRRKLGLKSPRFTIKLIGTEETRVALPRATPLASPEPGPDGSGKPGAPGAPPGAAGGAAHGAAVVASSGAGSPVLPAVGGCVPVRDGAITTGYRVKLDSDVFVTGTAVGPGRAGELSPATLVVIDGAGYGHGVGLSQWGAQGMALMRDESGKPLYTYVDILKHYYTGVEVVGNYNLPVVPAGPGPGTAPDVVPDAVPGAAPGQSVPSQGDPGGSVPPADLPATDVSFERR
ncbi:MAG: SpoIID/LytB domain-containing protein [Bacteroidota bacterium]